MNGTDVELRRELWMWRGVGIFLLCLLLLLYYIDARTEAHDRDYDNRQRAEHWAKMESLLQENRSLIHQAVATDTTESIKHFQSEADSDRSQRSMILKNYEAILRVDEHLRQCVGCHSHGNIQLK